MNRVMVFIRSSLCCMKFRVVKFFRDYKDDLLELSCILTIFVMVISVVFLIGHLMGVK